MIKSLQKTLSTSRSSSLYYHAFVNPEDRLCLLEEGKEHPIHRFVEYFASSSDAESHACDGSLCNTDY
jgi:hypothetical protein